MGLTLRNMIFNQVVDYGLIRKGGGNDNHLPTLEGCAVMFTKYIFILNPPLSPNDMLR